MSVEIRPTSDWWYGRYVIVGKRFCVNLGVKIVGERPVSLTEKGDETFERSRLTAENKLAQVIADARSTQGAARLVERIYEIKTGENLRSIPLKKLAEEWEDIPRRRKPNARYADQCKSTLGRFVTFITEANPDAHDIAHVTRDLARAFMKAETARGVTAKTWNDTFKLLRATFKHILPPGAINPFYGIPTKEVETVFRHPFTAEELQAITKEAESDPLIYPVIITGISTAMRRGDCCMLKWKDVDLAGRFINVKTAKTGQTVTIPIFPMLYDVLSKQKKGGDYVFPEIARLYLANPDSITTHVRKVFALAGFKDADADKPDEVIRGSIHSDRTGGLRRASVRDFHSFRVTWVTLALTAGVPLELVQKVTGHKTAEIVMKHYFHPGREAFRTTLQNAMPRLLSQPQGKTLRDEMLDAIAEMKTRLKRKDHATLLALAQRVAT